MLDLNSFKILDIDEKIHYLWSILHPIVNHDKDWERNLEIFLFGSSDAELSEFYEIMLNPEKIDSYIEKKWKQIKEWNAEIKNLENLLNCAKIEMQEGLDKEDLDKILEDI